MSPASAPAPGCFKKASRDSLQLSGCTADHSLVVKESRTVSSQSGSKGRGQRLRLEDSMQRVHSIASLGRFPELSRGLGPVNGADLPLMHGWDVSVNLVDVRGPGASWQLAEVLAYS